MYLFQVQQEKVQALERELDGAHSDFKDLNTQLDQSELQITTLKEERDSLKQRLSLEQEGREKERDEMKDEIALLKSEVKRNEEELTQVIDIYYMYLQWYQVYVA